MADINLLPQQVKEKGSLLRFSATAKKISIIVVFGVLTLGLLYGGLSLYYYLSENATSKEEVRLINEIKALEPTEQKVVLLRDRIRKAGKILSLPSTNDEAISFIDLTNALPEDVSIENVKLQPSEFEVTLKANESRQLSEFIRQLVSSGKYQRVELSSLSFSPKERYLLVVKLVNAPK